MDKQSNTILAKILIKSLYSRKNFLESKQVKDLSKSEIKEWKRLKEIEKVLVPQKPSN